MVHDHGPTPAGANKRNLTIVFSMTAAYLVVEVIGGVVTGSLALLADAGHMLTDAAGVGLALLAIRFAERPATPERTYGYYRVEILAALANAIVLIGISAYVLYEAWERLRNPPPVESRGMLLVATLGLAVNLIGIVVLRQGSKESLNMKGAYFEVLSDALASVAVIIAAAIMWLTGWYYADPILSAGIGLFILPRTWILLREAVGILLEGTPSGVNLAAIREAVGEVAGVQDMHDLHVWTITSGMNAMSAHVVVTDPARYAEVLGAVHDLITSRFPIAHVTIQIENAGWRDCETHL